MGHLHVGNLLCFGQSNGLPFNLGRHQSLLFSSGLAVLGGRNPDSVEEQVIIELESHL